MDLAAPEGLARELRGIESPGRDPPAGGARRLFENPASRSMPCRPIGPSTATERLRIWY